MKQQEEILQEYLQQIENGTPLRQVLASLPAEHRELGDLLVIAAKTHAVVHPTLPESVISSQRQRVMASVASAANTTSAHLAASPTIPRQSARRATPRAFARLAPLAFAAAAMMTLTVLVIFAALAFYVSTANAAHTATLEAVDGIVEAAPGDDPNNWAVMSSGDRIKAGMRLRTRTDSNVILRFFDGSRALLGERSELTLTDLDGSYNPLRGKSLQVRFRQTAGESQHQVVPLKGSSSFYEVLTPSGNAVVHGTVFQVAVENNGYARFAVSRGIVEVTQANNQVLLNAGQATISGPDQALLPPTFEYSIQGQIDEIRANQWDVDGVTFTVDQHLASAVSFTANDWVAVRGRVLNDGSFVADRIADANEENNIGYYTGSVENMTAASWTVSGIVIQIDGSTDISAGIKLNDTVKVYFTIQPDGSWLASAIQKMDDEDDDDENNLTATPSETAVATATKTGTTTPEQTETEDPNETAEPSKTVEPTLSGTALPSGTPEVSATPEGTRNGCEAEDKVNHKGEELASQWGVPYKEIIGWFCQGFGFGEIDLAYELAKDAGKPVDEIFAMKSGGMGWGLIKQSVKKNQPTLESGTPQPEMTPEPKKDKGKDDKNNNGNNGNNNKNNNGKKK